MSLCFRKQSVEQEISSLFGKTAQELRKVWKKYFPSEAPPYYKKYLIDKIAYRMQEIEYGKLSKEEERKLNSLADRAEQGKKVSGDELLPGTKLIKEYNGKNHEVLVTDMGFIYEGQFFTSLSAIAGKITGMSYNGPRLFGLREKTRKKQ
ncbi:DUF2924 domain-containing protein [Wolbachia endosymbiont (group E) of Neria commutata]|uniref:DUF2924 domain-containing protein n=1 Tax=Wolbachia endosymbiont (group E) of Neria commutata TaxID=3066149 RepID=UPI003132AACA